MRYSGCVGSAVVLVTVCSAAAGPSLVYPDDDDGRALAEVSVDASGAAPVIRASAVGWRIAPAAGFEHVAGANVLTARQFEAMRSGRATLRIVTYDSESREPIFGEATFMRRVALPVRRLSPDGRIDYHARTEPLPTVMTIDPAAGADGPLRPGRYRTAIEVHGHARMRMGFATDASGVSVIDITPAAAAVPITLAQEAEQAAPQGPTYEGPPPGLEVEAFERRDLEGRWVLYTRLADDAPTKAHWWAWLAREKQFELLETIALYERGAATPIGGALQEADAPQWQRVLAWAMRDRQNHGHALAEQKILRRPEAMHSWMRKHPSTQTDPYLLALFEELSKAKLEAVKVDAALPPFDEAHVLRHLSPPAELAAFGEREQAEPDAVYVHQVTRSIEGMIAGALMTEPWLKKLDALRSHDAAEVRQQAYLAYTYAPQAIDADAFERAVDDADEKPMVREAAMLAFTYGPDARAYAKALNVAADTQHPAWKAAVSRLGDLGDEFAIERLSPLVDRPTPDGKLLREALQRIEQQTVAAYIARHEKAVKAKNAPINGWRATFEHVVNNRLTRVVRAEAARDPLYEAMRASVVATIRRHLDVDLVRAAVMKAMSSDEPEIAALARHILAEQARAEF